MDEAERRMVAETDGRRFADSMKVKFFETSAKENLNVEEVIFKEPFNEAFFTQQNLAYTCVVYLLMIFLKILERVHYIINY